MVHYLIIGLTVLVAILLILIVLIQKSKGGGLSSQFGGAGAVLGVRTANSGVEKGTWILVTLLVILSIASAFTTTTKDDDTRAKAATSAPVEQPAGQFNSPEQQPAQ